MMKRIGKRSAVIGAFVISIGCMVLGATLPKTAASADIAVDYMENLQDLSYTTTAYGEEVTLKYRLWIPEDYDANKEYPMITMLHGHGGQGTDNTTQINVFKPLLSKMTTLGQQAKTPCIMLIPQCRPNHKWVEVSHWTGHYSINDFVISPDLKAVVELQDKIMEDYSVDEERQCVTGHSMGGLATWDLISRFPTRYAAAMPISGAGNDLEAAEKLTGVNVWAAHGALDPVVGVDVSRDMVDAVRTAGGWVRYTEYSEGDHSIGAYTYQTENDVVDFFMTARRGVKSSYIPDTTVITANNVAGDSFAFYNSAPAYNSDAARDWNGKHYASFNALSVNLPSTDATSGLINVNFPFISTDMTATDAAIRIRIQTLVPAIANEALRFDLMGSTTSYMTTSSSLYLLENGTTATLTVTGSGTGAAVNVVSGASATTTKLVDGYLIIPASVWGSPAGITALNVRTNKIYAKNVWNFGDIEYGTYTNGSFTASKMLWSAYKEDGTANSFTVDSGVDAVLVKANTFTGTTENLWLKSSFESTTGKVNISAYDGIRLYVDNSTGSVKKSIQVYLFSTDVAEANCKPAYGWKSNYGLAYFKPDADCTAFKNSFAYRSSFVPAGFKGEVYIPFTVNADAESGCFEPRESAPATFPTEIYSNFLVYFHSIAGETMGIRNLGLIADDTAFMKSAFETTTGVNLATEDSETIMVQSGERLASQFEFWVANKSGVFFATGNETNEEFLGGSALAVSIENLNGSPFIFSVKTWNNLGDITALGGNIVNGTIQFVQADGSVETLSMNNGYVTIPANAKGTLILPYVGSREVTTAVGGTTSYALGYPVKHVFRLIFNAFDHTGDATYLLGRIAVVNGDGTYSEINVEEQGIAALAAQSEDGTYKKNRLNVAYSGGVKSYSVSHETRDGATISENVTSAKYGSEVVFTVSGLAAGDSVVGATINGVDVTSLLKSDGGVYTYTTVAKENLVFAVALDSDPKDCNVTVNAEENGSVSVENQMVKENEQFSVTITADTHYRVSSVKVNGVEKVETLIGGVLTVTIMEDTQIVLTFAPIDYTIAYVLNGGENASENITSFNIESEAFTLLPATRDGYVFDGWYIGEDKVEIISDEILCNLTLEAKWSKKTYTLGYEINTNQGSISPAQMNAEYGEVISYTVTANDGYAIKEIKVNGTAVTHENGAFSVTVSENVTISVVFEGTTQPEFPVDSGDSGEDNGGSGCGSVIGAGAGILGVGVIAAAVVFIKKKED